MYIIHLLFFFAVYLPGRMFSSEDFQTWDWVMPPIGAWVNSHKLDGTGWSSCLLYPVGALSLYIYIRISSNLSNLF